MTIKHKAKSEAKRFLEDLLRGPLAFGELIEAIRVGEDKSQVEFAKMLGISKSHLCDIEKGRKSVSPLRAVKFARVLGYSEKQFVRLALQDMINEAGIKMIIDIETA